MPFSIKQEESVVWAWVKAHKAWAIAFAVGFVIGVVLF